MVRNHDINPTKAEFKKLAGNNNLIILSQKFYSDWLTPLSIYYGLRKEFKGESFLLESVEGEEKICRFSFLGFSPLSVFRSKRSSIDIRGWGAAVYQTRRDPLYELKKLMKKLKAAPKENLRFFGGFVGYMGYDTVRFYEKIGPDLPDKLNTPDICFVLPKFLVIFDHLKRQVEILSFVIADSKGSKELGTVYRQEVRKIKRFLGKVKVPHQLPELDFMPKKINISSNFTKEDFMRAVRKAKWYIREGEIIQTVLSQRFKTVFRKDPFKVYRYLRILNPSPYMFYLDLGDTKLAGSSPEMLLRCEKEELITRPIAGTRKRGRTEHEDLRLEESLLADSKEKAEHLMLVDLARNDLGRVAGKGSVNIPIFMSVERFSHVMHIVSEVRAALSKKDDIFSSIISCFPAGTLSGAPKIRAMQIINELEPDKRGIYGGSVGYFSFTKSLDTCIIIRTIVFKGKNAYIQAGAGIVADSKPEKEYQETVNKAKAQVLALGLAK